MRSDTRKTELPLARRTLQTERMTLRMQVLPQEASASAVSKDKKASETGKISSTSITLINLEELIDHQERAESVREKVIQDSTVETNLPILEDLYTKEPEPFAEGGQATISTASDKPLCRTIAVKTLKEKFKNNSLIKSNFIREAQLTSQLDHPSIIPLYALMTDAENGLHIGMKLIRGNTLKDRLEQIRQKYESMGISKFDEHKSMVLRIERFLNICDALSYAHAKGIIHCDLKPENIMIGEYGTTCLTDWGIARNLDASGYAEDFDEPGTISGTPRYISPETIRGEKQDCRSDIFSLGLILFELVTLDYATVGKEPKEIMLNTRDGILNPIQHKFGYYIDSDLAAIIKKATANKRENRYSTVEDLSTDIRRWLAGMTVKANPPNFLKKIGRWTANHIMLITISALIFGIAAAAIAITTYIYREKEILAEQARNHWIFFAASQFFISGSELDKTALNMESAVSAIASRASFLYQFGSPVDKPIFETFPVPGTQDFVPADFGWAPAYKNKISLSDFSCVIPSDSLKRTEALVFIRKLYPIRETFRQTYLGQVKFREEDTFRNQGVFMARFYAAFENGVHITYPGSRAHFRNYDPRKRTWYIETLKTRKLHWTEPYTDSQNLGMLISCTAPIIVKDKLIGVVGADLSIKHLDRMLNTSGNQKDYVLDKILISDTGKILMGKSSRRQYSLNDAAKNETTELPHIDEDLLLKIRRRQNGSITIKENGKDVLLFFMKLHALSGFYIEKIDLVKLHNYSLN